MKRRRHLLFFGPILQDKLEPRALVASLVTPFT